MALLPKGVCVSLVDLVTVRLFNLYAELLELLRESDPEFGPEPPPTYAVTCRKRRDGTRPLLQSWAYPLRVGEKLPTLPLWLSDGQGVWLDLEASYEEVCRVLRIRS